MAAQLHFFRKALLACAVALPALDGVRTCAYGFPFSFHRRHARPLVVAYLTDSSLYEPKPFFVKSLVTNETAVRLDQINYSAAAVDDGRCSLADPLADLLTPYGAATSVNGQADGPRAPVRGYFHQLEELKRMHPDLKILISLEGRASDFAFDSQPENRAAFVRSCVDLYLRGQFAPGLSVPGLFDGIDIDWESPGREDAANFEALVREFRRQMDALRPGFKLSIALGQSPHMMPGTNLAELAPLVNEFGIMNYDYWGPWFKTTGLIAPLFSRAGPHDRANIERTLVSYEAAGLPRGKMLMGLPFYGYGWTAVNATNEGLYQHGQPVRGDRPYRVIRALATPGSVYRDPRSRAPWIFDGTDFWTYEDPVSIRYKVSFAARHHLGGVMIWELSGDSPDGELLNTAWTALHHPLRAKVFARAEKAPDAPALAQR